MIKNFITKKYYWVTALALTFLPQFVSAAVCNINSFSVKGIGKYLLYPACIITKILVPLAIVLELVLFISGIVRYIANADNETERSKGNKFMIWGLIALFVTLSVWGIIGLISNTLQLGKNM